MSRDEGTTGRRARLVREYVETPPSDPPPSQGDTGRFLVVPDGRVGYIPPQQPCPQHSGIKAEIRHLQEDVRESQTSIHELTEKIRRLEMLPWRVVAAAVGGGGGVAGVVELLRALFSAGG